MSKGKDDAPHELESQFVLRLPPVRAGSGPRRVTPGSPGCGSEGLTRQWGSCASGKACGGSWVLWSHSHPFERIFHGLS